MHSSLRSRTFWPAIRENYAGSDDIMVPGQYRPCRQAWDPFRLFQKQSLSKTAGGLGVVGTMKVVELRRQQIQELVCCQGVQVPGQVELAEDICETSRTSRTSPAKPRPHSTSSPVVIKSCSGTDNGVTGHQRRTGSDQRDERIQVLDGAAEQRESTFRCIAVSSVNLKRSCEQVTAGSPRVFEVRDPPDRVTWTVDVVDHRTEFLEPAQSQPCPESGIVSKSC